MTRLASARQPFRAGLLLLGLLAGATSMAWGQQRIFLYFPDQGSTKLFDYDVNTGTGVLTPLTNTITTAAPVEVVLGSNSKFVFVGADGAVNAFNVDPSGALTAPAGGSVNTNTVNGLAVDNSGKYLFVSVSNTTTSRIDSYTINQTTGALTALGSVALTPWVIGGVAIDSANHLYVAVKNDTTTPAGFVAAYTIAANGGLTAIGTFAPGTQFGPQRVIVAPANGTHGELLISPDSFNSAVSVFTIGGGGALSLVGGPVPVGAPGTTRPWGGAVTPNGNVFIMTDVLNNAANVYTYTIGAGGVLSAVAVYNAGSEPTGIAIDPSGTNAYVSNPTSHNLTRFAINGTTGVLSGSFNIALGGGATPQFLTTHYAPTVLSTVPTLQTWVLVVLGFMLAALAFFMSRKTARQS